MSVPTHPRWPIQIRLRTCSIMTFCNTPYRHTYSSWRLSHQSWYRPWEGDIGPEGVGKCSSNGLLLVRKCAEHDLLSPAESSVHLIETKHPGCIPKHRHFIDYAIVRRTDRQDVSDNLIESQWQSSLNIFYCQTQRGWATSSDNINYSPSPTTYLQQQHTWQT